MRYRKLRIAWSVAWGVVAVLLCVLWVRSYSWTDMTRFSEVISSNGKLHFNQTVMVTFSGKVGFGPLEARRRIGIYTMQTARIEIVKRSGDGPTIPYWSLVLTAIVLSGVPWLRYRFSLRTLLIATTLIAIALGLFAYNR